MDIGVLRPDPKLFPPNIENDQPDCPSQRPIESGLFEVCTWDRASLVLECNVKGRQNDNLRSLHHKLFL